MVKSARRQNGAKTDHTVLLPGLPPHLGAGCRAADPLVSYHAQGLSLCPLVAALRAAMHAAELAALRTEKSLPLLQCHLPTRAIVGSLLTLFQLPHRHQIPPTSPLRYGRSTTDFSDFDLFEKLASHLLTSSFPQYLLQPSPTILAPRAEAGARFGTSRTQALSTALYTYETTPKPNLSSHWECSCSITWAMTLKPATHSSIS